MPTVIKNVVSMELCGLEIPDSYYQISRNLGNDYFWLGFEDEWYFIAVTEGNYNRKTIVDVINQQISLAFGGTSKIFFLIDKTSLKSSFVYKDSIVPNPMPIIKIAFNRLRSDFVSTQVSTSTVLPEIDISAPGGIMGKLGWILGFRMAEYTDKSGYVKISKGSNPVGSSNCYISEGVYNVWTNRYFYIVVDDFNKNANNFIVPTFAASLGSANILARITLNPPIAFEAGYTLTTGNAWNNTTTKKRSYFGPVDVTKLKFQILDSFGRIVNLNNMDCSFALNMVCLYDY